MAALAALFGSAPVAAAVAKTPHLRLLRFKPCNYVLAPGDFEDNLAEIYPPAGTSDAGVTAQISICKYASSEAAAGALEKNLSKGEIAGECLAHALLADKEAAERGEEAHLPPSGCYRLVTVSVLYARGKPVSQLAARLQKGARSKRWPAGYGRYLAHGVGDRSEFGYDAAGQGYGYVQLDNAEVTVETGEVGVLLTVLRDAASTL